MLDRVGVRIRRGDTVRSWNLSDNIGHPAICKIFMQDDWWYIRQIDGSHGYTGLPRGDGRFGVEVLHRPWWSRMLWGKV